MTKNEDSFMEVCEAMGGEYESEYGYVEPDVGGEFLHGRDVGKEWCTFKNMKGLGENQRLIVFNSKNTFSLRCNTGVAGGEEFFDLWDNDINTSFSKEKQQMVFETKYGVRLPKGKYKIRAYPLREFGEPRSIKLHIED